MGRKVGGAVSRSKMVDLDGLRVCDMPINSVTYLLLNRPQQDPPIFAYSHIIKRQLVVQVCAYGCWCAAMDDLHVIDPFFYFSFFVFGVYE